MVELDDISNLTQLRQFENVVPLIICLVEYWDPSTYTFLSLSYG